MERNIKKVFVGLLFYYPLTIIGIGFAFAKNPFLLIAGVIIAAFGALGIIVMLVELVVLIRNRWRSKNTKGVE
ncbi:MAG: hypothetical protein HYW15_00705 [Candidatus Giovannonibacteria bacterium]|nr:MAG: hypothetical protein HYW15_00705 [Candidatus Giovannonibacteria bacterium]